MLKMLALLLAGAFALSLGFLILYTPFIIVWFIVDKPPKEAILLYYGTAAVVIISHLIITLWMKLDETTPPQDEAEYERVFCMPKNYKESFFGFGTVFLLLAIVTLVLNNYLIFTPAVGAVLLWHFWMIYRKNQRIEIFANQRIALHNDKFIELGTQKTVDLKPIEYKDNHKQGYLEAFDGNTRLEISHYLEDFYVLRAIIDSSIEQRKLVEVEKSISLDLPQKYDAVDGFIKQMLMLWGGIVLLSACMAFELYVALGIFILLAWLIGIPALFTTPLVMTLDEECITLRMLLGKKKIPWTEVNNFSICNTNDDERYSFDLHLSETKSYSLKHFEDAMKLYKTLKALREIHGKDDSKT